MGADMKSLRNRIKSVDSTLHLTHAMGLVASSKIRRALERMEMGRQYEAAVRNAIEPLLSTPSCRKSKYLNPISAETPKTALIVIAGDRGLAGGYNANIFRALKEIEGEVEIIPIGKRACDKLGDETVNAERFDYAQANEMAQMLCGAFVGGEYQSVKILSTRYRTMLSQEVNLDEILPLRPIERPSSEAQAPRAEVIFEPDEESVLHAAVPTYVAGILLRAVRESFACEVAARRCAMDSAGKNAKEMIESLTLQYNRARQGAITQEITEIVAGSGS